VLIDTKVLVSYLLGSRRPGAIAQVVESALEGAFSLLLPRDLTEELLNVLLTNPKIAKRVEARDSREFIAYLEAIGESLSVLEEAAASVTRDPKDDYLIAYALAGQADYLVTGDSDLLVLGEVGGVQIVTPVEFAALLAAGAE
jgi:hypothetical protein